MVIQSVDIRLRGVAYAAAFLTFSLVVIGGIVRITGSGMGCPDWPLCYGQLIPPFEFHTLIEYVHRLVALLVAFAIAGLAMWSFLKRRQFPNLPKLTSVVVFLYFLQAAFGGITVLTGNTPWSVSLHLGNAMLLFGSLLVIATLIAYRRQPGEIPRARQSDLAQMSLINAAGVLVLILSGSYVVGSSASGACVSWPLCDANIIPTDILQWVHMGHRLFALLVGVYLIMTCLRARNENGAVETSGTWLIWMFIAQVIVGGANVLLGFPIVLNVLHLALATSVWGLAVILATVARLESGRRWMEA